MASAGRRVDTIRLGVLIGFLVVAPVTAFVRSGALDIDPPDDHLYLTSAGQSARHLMELGADMAWSKAIFWARDSRKVGFVVNDDRVAIFDVGTGTLDAMFYLIGHGECCGGPEAARHVSFGDDGSTVRR
jgi:hypothetical protein